MTLSVSVNDVKVKGTLGVARMALRLAEVTRRRPLGVVVEQEDAAMSDLLRENRSMPDRRRGHRRRAISAATLQVPPTAAMSKSLWDALEVARYLKVSRNWVYQQADAGWLPSVRMGGLRRFDPDKIRAFGSGEKFTPLLPKRT